MVYVFWNTSLVAWSIGTKVSHLQNKKETSTLKYRQQFQRKGWQLSTNVHVITGQKIIIWSLTVRKQKHKSFPTVGNMWQCICLRSIPEEWCFLVPLWGSKSPRRLYFGLLVGWSFSFECSHVRRLWLYCWWRISKCKRIPKPHYLYILKYDSK